MKFKESVSESTTSAVCRISSIRCRSRTCSASAIALSTASCQNGTFKAVKCGKLWRINRDSVLSYIGVTIDRTECPSTNIN